MDADDGGRCVMMSVEFLIIISTVLLIGLTLFGAIRLSSYLIDLQFHRLDKQDETEEDRQSLTWKRDTEHECCCTGKKVPE